MTRAGLLLLVSWSASAASPSPSPSPSPPNAPLAEPSYQSSVQGVRGRQRSAGEYEIPLAAFAIVPRLSGSDLLTAVPGVTLTNDGNEGHAAHVYLRGFYGEDGSDTALSVEGIPLNDVSNPEKHGYTDVFMMMPELVDRLEVTEGVADPRQGDFAVAGSIDYRLALRQRGETAQATYGRFNTVRLVGLYGPSHESDETFAGAEYAHSDGYGSERRYDRGTLLGQWAHDFGGTQLKVLFGFTAAHWQSPGVVREDDYDAGRIGFYDGYASAAGQGGTSTQALLGVTLERRSAVEQARFTVWGRFRDYTLDEDFSGYYDHPLAGDLTRYVYRGGTVGGQGWWRRTLTVRGLPQEVEIGALAKYDRYTPSSTQMDARTGLPIDPPDPDDSSGRIGVANLALWADLAARPAAWLVLRAAVRADLLFYQADVSTVDESSGAEVSRHYDAFGSHVGPKATIGALLGRGFSLLASFGEGYRSADAMTLTGHHAPIDGVLSDDLGLRYARGSGERARAIASVSFFHSYVADDHVFDPLLNHDVTVGAAHRVGVAAWARGRPLDWLTFNVSFVYVRSIVEVTALEGHLHPGAPLPYLPPIVARLDAALDRQVAHWGRFPVSVRAGVGLSVRGPTPLVTLPDTRTVVLVDLGAGVCIGPVDLSLQVRNLLDARWREADYESPSNFVPGTPSSAVPVENFTAGLPATALGTVALHL